MKKYFAMFVVLAVLMLSVTCFAEEIFAPGFNDTGTIGTTSRYWGEGYFDKMANFRYEVASKDWGSATGTWTLNATEQRAALLYVKSLSATGGLIVAPSEEGRVYRVYNNGGYSITIKKSGGTGILINNNVCATVMYFTTSGGTDYHLIASGPF